MNTWWMDELARAGSEHLDPGYVDAYDRKAGFDPTEDIEALRAVGVGPDSVVLDLGAGTGTFAVAVAAVCKQVVAVDISPAMANAMRRRVADLGLENVSVVEAGLLSYVHQGEPADAIFTRNALHQLPDFWKAIALDRMATLLRPGGVLRLRDLIFDFVPAEAEALIEAWMTGAVTDPATGWTAEELAAHVRDEFSTYSWLLERMLDVAGFEIIHQSFRRRAYGTYTATRRIA